MCPTLRICWGNATEGRPSVEKTIGGATKQILRELILRFDGTEKWIIKNSSARNSALLLVKDTATSS